MSDVTEVDLGDLSHAADRSAAVHRDCEDTFVSTSGRMSEAVADGWVGRSGAVMAEALARWERTHQGLLDRVHHHARGFVTSHDQYQESEHNNAGGFNAVTQVRSEASASPATVPRLNLDTE